MIKHDLKLLTWYVSWLLAPVWLVLFIPCFVISVLLWIAEFECADYVLVPFEKLTEWQSSLKH